MGWGAKWCELTKYKHTRVKGERAHIINWLHTKELGKNIKEYNKKIHSYHN